MPKTELTPKSLVGNNCLMLKVFDRGDHYVTKMILDGEKMTPIDACIILRSCWRGLLDDLGDDWDDKQLQKPRQKVL